VAAKGFSIFGSDRQIRRTIQVVEVVQHPPTVVDLLRNDVELENGEKAVCDRHFKDFVKFI
jgi:hypothetical protein